MEKLIVKCFAGYIVGYWIGFGVGKIVDVIWDRVALRTPSQY